MTLLSFIYFIIASQGFLLTILLFFKKNIEIHLPLILFLLFSSIDFAFQFLYTTNIILNYPHIIYINEPLTLLKGSLIFMYIRNVYHAKKVFYKKDLLMLLPFIIYTFYYSKFYSLPANIKLIEYNNFIKVGLLMNENLIEWFFELLINLFFVWASINLLKKTSVRIKNEYSDISKFNYNIAKKLLIGVLIVYIFEIITILLCYLGFNYCELSNNTSYLVSAIILYLLGYNALMGHNNIIFQTNNNSNTIKLQELNSQLSKYKNNSLTKEQSDIIIQKLKHAMEVERLFIDPDIRLTTLSDSLSESPNNVSQIINQYFEQNFYDFINTYRINEAKKIIKSEQYSHLTIEAIGIDVGFKSKSTFYNSFKKNTLLTPLEFKKKLTKARN